MQDLEDRSYLYNDGKSVTFLKLISQWQDYQFKHENSKVLDGLLKGSLSDIPQTYYIHDLDVIIQSSHKVATTSLAHFMVRLRSEHKLNYTRYESFDDMLLGINQSNTRVYRLLREPVCRLLSNINFQSRKMYKLHGITLDIANYNPLVGIDPHSSPQSGTMLCYVNQTIYDNMVKLRASSVRSYIKNVLADSNQHCHYGDDIDHFKNLVNQSDNTLLTYYKKFRKIDTTYGHFHNDLNWSHLYDIKLYENAKYFWVSETSKSVFDDLAKELGISNNNKTFDVNKTPNIPIGNQMPYKIDNIDPEIKHKLYEAYKPEIDFLKGLDYINTEAIFYDQ